ncbi:hypothetical protein HNQ56_004465 [Anaerotaenia torta]|uniref:hypothetical protein n=1 Tax=Anaerotaenia torta TaxID=433293 RepID=UPI003D212921
MDPISFTSAAAYPTFLPTYGYFFAPGIFLNEMEGNNYLSSLDSDTRDYVLKHTDEFRSRQDIEDCVSKLRNG